MCNLEKISPADGERYRSIWKKKGDRDIRNESQENLKRRLIDDYVLVYTYLKSCWSLCVRHFPHGSASNLIKAQPSPLQALLLTPTIGPLEIFTWTIALMYTSRFPSYVIYLLSLLPVPPSSSSLTHHTHCSCSNIRATSNRPISLAPGFTTEFKC